MSEIPRAVLSEALQAAINSRTVIAAVFLTFRFDPGFFEEEILPIVLDVPTSNVPELRVLQLESFLRSGTEVAVYYDRRGLEAESKPARLDIARIGVTMPRGYFHPKVVMLLVENPPSADEPERTTRSLIVMAGSANVTRAGWWENVECAHIEQVDEGQPCSFRGDLLDLITRVRRACRRDERHTAIEMVRSFVRELQDGNRTSGGVVNPRLFSGGTSFVEFMRDSTASEARRGRLEIISPYFDETDSIVPIADLREKLKPEEVRIVLPKNDSNQAACSSAYYERVRATGAVWSELPKDLMKWSQTTTRRLHAKVYRLTNRSAKREVLFIGSVNLTNAGFDGDKNFEAGWLLDSVSNRRPDWWLGSETATPVEFLGTNEEETLPLGSAWRLSVRCIWSSGSPSVTCFWDGSDPSPVLLLSSQKAPLFELESFAPRTEYVLDAIRSEQIATALRSSSFIEAAAHGEEPIAILVQEEGMEFKPSIVTSFTSTDILKWWSLLTPEQQKEFLEQRADLVADPTVALWLGAKAHTEQVDRLFSTFAETYHSFGNLARTIRSAFDEERLKEARDRLFGQKFDTLRRLLVRITAEEREAETVVERYVQLLCAKQLLRELVIEQREFFRQQEKELKELEALLHDGEALGEQFSFGTADERVAFFKWFERWFIDVAKPAEIA